MVETVPDIIDCEDCGCSRAPVGVYGGMPIYGPCLHCLELELLASQRPRVMISPAVVAEVVSRGTGLG